ncbi:MAG: hypothetical protein ACRDWN_04755, partial [Acidimicrobiales bacterium]
TPTLVEREGREGRAAPALAADVLAEAGFTVIARDRRLPGTGMAISLVATDGAGVTWYFDVAGPCTTRRGGLLRNEVVWKTLGRTHVLSRRGVRPVVVLSSQLPRRPGPGDTALRGAGPEGIFDVVDLLSPDGLDRLRRYAKGGRDAAPSPGFWTTRELG